MQVSAERHEMSKFFGGLHPDLIRKMEQRNREFRRLLADGSIPQFVQQLAMLDLAQGPSFWDEINQLVGKGMSIEAAKAKVYPEDVGVSFIEVWRAMQGKPAVTDFGSASVLHPAAIPLMWKMALADSCLGISHCDGGGPFVMGGTAYQARKAEELVRKHRPLSRIAEPENFVVLLSVGEREKPHRWASRERTVWPQRFLMGRPEQMFSLGTQLCLRYSLGGWGTGEELFDAGPFNQLLGRGKLLGPFASTVPMLLLDMEVPFKDSMEEEIYRAQNEVRERHGHKLLRKTVWEGCLNHLNRCVEMGTIKSQEISWVHRVMVEDSEAALESYLTILSASSQKLLGYDIIAAWQEANNRSLKEFVNLLETEYVPTHQEVVEASLMARD
jgi:hypothetical protein